MSYREIRDFSEHLRMLDYPHSVTIPQVNNGGFTTLTTMLQWLADRVETGSTIAGDPNTEAGRVQLIRSAVEFMALKAGIKLNPRRLYSCGGNAAKELLKVTTMLVSAPKAKEEDPFSDNTSALDLDLMDKVEELRIARGLASELTARGATLYDLLEKEKDNKDLRIHQSTRALELPTVEAGLKAAIEQLKVELADTETSLAKAKAESESLAVKIQRKETECDRANQRLTTLNKVRPAFLDELERLEEELSDVYEKYVLYVRCQASLKAQLTSPTETNDDEQASPDQKHAKIILSQNKSRGIPAGYDINLDDDDTDLDDLDESIEDTENIVKMSNLGLNGDKKPRAQNRLRVRTGAGVERGRVFGGMGPNAPNLGASDNSLGNSSDSLGLGRDVTEGDMLTDDEESLRFDDMGKPPVAADMPDASDEDF